MHERAFMLKTARFNSTDSKPHFINERCFGEDFAAWLSTSLGKAGLRVSDAIQEDWGWGFWAVHEKDSFWIALSYAGDGPQEEPAEWVVSVNYDAGLNLIKRLFHKPNRQAFALLRERIWQAIKSNSAMRIIEDGNE